MLRKPLVLLVLATLGAAGVQGADLISLRNIPCGKAGEAGGLGAGTDLTRITVDTNRFPLAVCNDGTPAVFYIRPATVAQDSTKWHISLQGGGSCKSGQDCAERWCSFDTNFGMDKMTTSLTKQSVRAGGILSPSSVNPFGTWNTVLIYYCSSDQWAGHGDHVETSAVSATGNVNYAIHFHGADILDAVIEMLRSSRRRAVERLPRAAPLLPDLDLATEVLLSGSSGGGNGIIQNGDRLAALLRAHNAHCNASGCPLKVRLLIDSAFGSSLVSTDFAASEPCSQSPEACSYEGYYRSVDTLVNQAFHHSSPEDSCLDYHSRVEPGTEWRCADGTHVVENHITTPMFVGMDLQDSLVGGNYFDSGLATPTSFGQAVESQLRGLATLDAAAEEGSARTGIPISPGGAFGPQCTNHEMIGSDSDFRSVKVNVSGTLYSYQDVVWNWWSGLQPQSAVVHFQNPGPLPDCPPAN